MPVAHAVDPPSLATCLAAGIILAVAAAIAAYIMIGDYLDSKRRNGETDTDSKVAPLGAANDGQSGGGRILCEGREWPVVSVQRKPMAGNHAPR